MRYLNICVKSFQMQCRKTHNISHGCMCWVLKRVCSAVALSVQLVVNRGVWEDGGGLAAELVSRGREV